MIRVGQKGISAVLGGLMLAPEALDRVADVLVEEDFYRRDHRAIFRAVRELASKNSPFDAITLGEWLEANQLAEQAVASAARSSEEHTSELQSLMRISYAVFCLKKKNKQ